MIRGTRKEKKKLISIMSKKIKDQKIKIDNQEIKEIIPVPAVNVTQAAQTMLNKIEKYKSKVSKTK